MNNTTKLATLPVFLSEAHHNTKHKHVDIDSEDSGVD